MGRYFLYHPPKTNTVFFTIFSEFQKLDLTNNGTLIQQVHCTARLSRTMKKFFSTKKGLKRN